MHHDRTKHVEIDCHFIKEKINDRIIKLLHTTSSHQIADILTKALPIANYENLRSRLGMIDTYDPT